MTTPTGASPPPTALKASAERDEKGQEILKEENWQRMGMVEEEEEEDDNLFEQTFTRLYGKMSWNDKLRLLWLSGTLFFIIGGYWLLRSLKDPIISTIDGVDAIPKAKMLSVVVVTFGVAIYNKLYDMYEPHQLFYIIGGFYTGLFAVIGASLMHPTLGIYNTEADPTRILGWISYCAIESFGSIGVANFWAFANSVYDLESAKKSYGLLVACAQLGSVSGPTLVTQAALLGIPFLYMCGAGCMALMVAMVFFYVRRFGTDSGAGGSGKGGKKKKADMLEGLRLFWKYPYVQGITAVSCIFMVEVTILDYAMKVLAKAKFEAMHPDDPVAATQAFAQFMGFFGQATNALSFCLSLLGTSFVIRRLGLQKTILLFPVLLLGAGILVYFMPSLGLVFAMMLVLKALSYALNNPCKELLYQPTSQAVKFKAKSWIDIFGQRGAKAGGSVITAFFADNAAALLSYGMVFSMGLSVFLLYVSRWMGITFDEYVNTGYVVGGDFDELPVLAKDQARQEDTSCGIAEEGQEDGEAGKGNGTDEGKSISV
uniref:ADP,ATP carrier protein n=1 Tax=Rhizochromulina marina TaxID=1034831 RepID=A0A7S2SQY8_9STRA|mmetsp:Transcript_4775/g.14175  ORF Transcript_4775/g.14175 Transcript_4775/m.14175 type:complete len:542 (+) Transcript_4775:59-1684(+)|eukprot:CAMPEP_0118984688 /NCGR_PEP_ID=MMETSP1173-20130426/38311_1 /TAXON_ID=1034831 /ORGANISM="Rhizochromulina marina cf, Strain CCMP1243" /LENGTH=541 /DNA_ID=CAMNT_0006935365 /DNA_START=1 /DNA_END=1626 /DNA_ORIENTATION=+